MLKTLTLTLDTSDPLQSQFLVEYLASEDRVRFGRSCLLLGYLTATGQLSGQPGASQSASAAEGGRSAEGSSDQPQRTSRIGAALFGLD